MILMRRAVQRSIVSPFSNGIEEFEGQRRTKDSLGRKSLNLCEATESFGGCLEVIRTFPLAARNNPRSAARRRQTLPTAACPAVFHFRDCERCQLVSRHPYLHQGPSATAEQSLQDQMEKATRSYRHPVYFAGVEPCGC